MKKILFCFQQVGSVNALLPLLNQLRAEYELVFTGRPVVCRRLNEIGFSADSYKQIGWENGLSQCGEQWFQAIRPDLVVTDTINMQRDIDGAYVRAFWRWAQYMKIPSIAFMDCWWGSGLRFRLPGEDTIPILPDNIAVIDQWAKEDVVKAGVPAEKIMILGSPHFEQLARYGTEHKATSRKVLKTDIGLNPDHFIFLFVSQPLEKVFGSVDYYGFTEKTTLTDVLKSFKTFPESVLSETTLVILLHPEEDSVDLEEIIARSNANLTIEIRKEKETKDLILASDMVIGMFSILLAEAVILGRPVISIQINISREEILITNTIGATMMIDDPKRLDTVLQRCRSEVGFKKELLARQKKFRVERYTFNAWSDRIGQLLSTDWIRGTIC